MPRQVRMGSWLSDAVHDVAGWAAGNGNEPGTPASRAGHISDAELAADLKAATAAQPAHGIDTRQALMIGAAGFALWFAFRKP